MRRIDDLQCNGLVLVQDSNDYCFTSDAVLLANYFKASKGSKVVELCSGSGVISILGTAKTGAEHFYCFEISESLCNMANESVKLNKINNISVYNRDIVEAPQVLGNTKVDVVVVNPPYFKVGKDTLVSPNPKVATATHEVKTTLSTIAQVSSKLLKQGGKLYMCYPAERFAELCAQLINNGLQPKQATFVQGAANKPFSVVLVTATRGGKPGIKFATIINPNN